MPPPQCWVGTASGASDMDCTDTGHPCGAPTTALWKQDTTFWQGTCFLHLPPAAPSTTVASDSWSGNHTLRKWGNKSLGCQVEEVSPPYRDSQAGMAQMNERVQRHFHKEGQHPPHSWGLCLNVTSCGTSPRLTWAVTCTLCTLGTHFHSQEPLLMTSLKVWTCFSLQTRDARARGEMSRIFSRAPSTKGNHLGISGQLETRVRVGSRGWGGEVDKEKLKNQHAKK